MTDAEIDKWESYYCEAVQRDFERRIYRQCAEEDAAPAPGRED